MKLISLFVGQLNKQWSGQICLSLSVCVESCSMQNLFRISMDSSNSHPAGNLYELGMYFLIFCWVENWGN